MFKNRDVFDIAACSVPDFFASYEANCIDGVTRTYISLDYTNPREQNLVCWPSAGPQDSQQMYIHTYHVLIPESQCICYREVNHMLESAALTAHVGPQCQLEGK